MGYNNSPNYFSYKRQKQQIRPQPKKSTAKKINFFFQLFIATFIVIFIAIVVSIMKFSSKVDSEYIKGDLTLQTNNSSDNLYSYDDVDNEQRKIDKRLILIQQEENAPSEAKIISKEKKHHEVIAMEHVEKHKKAEKEHNKPKESKNVKNTNIIEEIKNSTSKKQETEVESIINKNVTIMSKVLIGKYDSFEVAQKVQSEIKAKDSSLTPFVKKVGDVYSIQMGSYQDFNTAKIQAHKLQQKGFDVWIFQQ